MSEFWLARKPVFHFGPLNGGWGADVLFNLKSCSYEFYLPYPCDGRIEDVTRENVKGRPPLYRFF